MAGICRFSEKKLESRNAPRGEMIEMIEQTNTRWSTTGEYAKRPTLLFQTPENEQPRSSDRPSLSYRRDADQEDTFPPKPSQPPRAQFSSSLPFRYFQSRSRHRLPKENHPENASPAKAAAARPSSRRSAP